MSVKQVCPNVPAPTDKEARRLIAEPLLRLSYAQGIDALARDLAVNEKTIRRGRDEDTLLRADTVIGLFYLDRQFRETLLHRVGERPVPVTACCDTDELISTSGAVHRLASVKCPTSPGGATITDAECLEIESEIDAALTALSAIKNRCNSIREKRAA